MPHALDWILQISKENERVAVTSAESKTYKSRISEPFLGILYQMSLIIHNKALFWETVANLNKKDNMYKQLISTLFDQSTRSEQEK